MVVNGIKAPHAIAILLLAALLSGCVGGDANTHEEQTYPDLILGTKIHVHNQTYSDFAEDEWEFHSVEPRMDRYGVIQEMGVFKSESGFTTTHEVSTSDFGFLEFPAGDSSWSSIHSSFSCIPHPLEWMVMLSGMTVPTTDHLMSIHGTEYRMNITGDLASSHVELRNGLATITANVTLPHEDFDGPMTVEAVTASNAACGSGAEQVAELEITRGDGEEIRFETGVSTSPHRSQSVPWPPESDVDSATFSLERAADRLALDPRYQDFAAGGDVWPVYLIYGDGYGWDWLIILAREDHQRFAASVSILKGLEGTPTEFVSQVDTSSGSQRDVQVDGVDFQAMDDAVSRYSEGKAGELINLRFERWDGVNPFVVVEREDPADDEKVFRCNFDGETGRVMGCNHVTPGSVY